jgi:hypothetical protein
MELLDRYLQAVKRHLPWQRQDDIIAELRANLEAQLEDKEAELGRPLTKEEAEEWLKQIGPPIQVAARYQRQQYLIGPAVFPTYWFVLQLALAWTTAIYVIARLVEIAAKGLGGEALLGAALQLPSIWLVNAAIVTLIFAAIELAGAKYPGKFHAFAPMTAPWSPGTWPPANAGVAADSRPRSLAKALAEVFFGCLFLAWLLLVPHYPFLLFGPGAWYFHASPYQLAPVWWPFYWCVVCVNVLELSWRLVDLARGAWQRPPKRVRHLVMHALSLVPLSVLLAAPEHKLFLLKNPAADAAAHGATVASANKGVLTAVTIIVAIVVLQLIWWIGRASVDAYRKHAAAIK